jgi:nitrogen fixation protein FixH
MLGYYTMAQTSFLLFMSVIVAMAVCMAWRVADEELAERLVSGRVVSNTFAAFYYLRF